MCKSGYTKIYLETRKKFISYIFNQLTYRKTKSKVNVIWKIEMCWCFVSQIAPH